MTRIVRTHYRYKRPPRKRAKAAASKGPVIVTGKGSRRPADSQMAAEVISRNPGMGTGAVQPSTATEATRDRAVTTGEKPNHPANDDRKSAIVTARKPRARAGNRHLLAELPDTADAAAIWPTRCFRR